MVFSFSENTLKTPYMILFHSFLIANIPDLSDLHNSNVFLSLPINAFFCTINILDNLSTSIKLLMQKRAIVGTVGFCSTLFELLNANIDNMFVIITC